MKWATLRYGPERLPHVGAVEGDGIYLLGRAETLLGLLTNSDGALADAYQRATVDPLDVVPVGRADLLSPIPTPPSIRDFMSFRQHIASYWELRGLEMPAVFDEQPVFYFTNPRALMGAYDDIPIPPGCQSFDFELEVAAVIGRELSNVGPEEAEAAIAGFCIMNDWSARDIQMREMQMDLGPAKGKDTATTLGPWLVTPDELELARNGTGYTLDMVARLNGDEVARDQWSNISWTFGEMISYASRGTVVSVGDVIGSGTCGGGCLAELRSRSNGDRLPWITDGDVVELEIEGIGRIRNRVVTGQQLVPLRPRSEATR